MCMVFIIRALKEKHFDDTAQYRIRTYNTVHKEKKGRKTTSTRVLEEIGEKSFRYSRDTEYIRPRRDSKLI